MLPVSVDTSMDVLVLLNLFLFASRFLRFCLILAVVKTLCRACCVEDRKIECLSADDSVGYFSAFCVAASYSTGSSLG